MWTNPVSRIRPSPPSTERRCPCHAVEAAEDENGVGEFVEAIDAGDGITDYRFVSLMRGYEGWQWSVTMFHDVERDTWTVNESTLIPMEQALRLRNGFHGRTVCCRPTCR